MSTELDLTAYLSEQAGEGTKESEGDFTISHKNARRKLARFALPRETAWVSKLVQAAVGWKMQKILAAQSKVETQFFFFTANPSDLPTEDDIVSNLLSGDVVADSPIEHFCLALRALVEQAGLSFILVINDGECKARPVYAGPHYGELSEEERLGARFNREVGVTLTVRHAPPVTSNTKISDLLSQTRYSLPIIEELKTYAYTCPIPIVVSGMHIEGFLNSRVFNTQALPLYLSGLRDLEHSPSRLPLPPSFEHKQLSYLTNPRRARRTYGGRRDFAAAFMLSSTPTSHSSTAQYRRSQFSWVRDGIVVQTKSLDISTGVLGLHIYANAEGLGSDLTGFQLVESEERTAREAEILMELAKAMREVSGRLEGFFAVDTDERSFEDEQLGKDAAYRKRLKTLIGGSGVGILLTLVNPPLGLVTTAASVAKTYVGSTLLQGEQSDVELARPDRMAALATDFGSLRLGLERLLHQLTSPDSAFGEIPSALGLDFDDEFACTKYIKAGAFDPEGLVEQLKLAQAILEKPKIDLLLARAYRMKDDPEAAIHYRRYLKSYPEADVVEELAKFHEEHGKLAHAHFLRARFAEHGKL